MNPRPSLFPLPNRVAYLVLILPLTLGSWIENPYDPNLGSKPKPDASPSARVTLESKARSEAEQARKQAEHVKVPTEKEHVPL